MEQLNFLERFIDWIMSIRYNCKKGRHRWGYCVSDVGVIYLDYKKIPKDKWICLDCKIKKIDYEK